MATLILRAYEPPPLELRRLREGPVPRWALRLYDAYGYQVENVPLSKVVNALSEELRLRLESLSALIAGAEELGWLVEPREDGFWLSTGLPWERSEQLLEEAGLLIVARALGPADGDGRLAWGAREPEAEELEAGRG